MPLERAYSALEIKAARDSARTIEGIATTPRPDRVGDVVIPEGVKFSLPLPLMLDHVHQETVGEVDFAEVTSKGINFRAHIKSIEEPGEAKDLVDKAWHYVKAGLRRFVSIGFRPLPDGYERLADGGLKFVAWEWLELSMVPVPANPDAGFHAGFHAKSLDEQIEIVREFDRRIRAGDPQIPANPATVAASGKSVRVVRLGDPARVRAEPYVIRSIKRTAR